MANPHFQNQIQWAGNTVATKEKKDQPMFMPLPSDQTHYGYFNDFMTYKSGDWTITTTEEGTGSATEAITSGAGGQFLITNAAGDNDHDFFNLKGESFLITGSKRAYFSARFKVSDATQSDFVMGLQITDTSPLAVSEGIFFIKDDGDTNLVYDPKDQKFHVFQKNVLAGTVVNTNEPKNQELALSFGIKNGAAAAKTLTVDYIGASKERTANTEL